MVISIRRSRHEEGEELVAIWCRSVDATHDFLSAEYRAELEVLVRSFLPEAPLWVAVNERDQPVGFMLLSGQHMDALFIDPDVCGCGVGRMLVEHALSMAPELTTNVNEQNEQAVGFMLLSGQHMDALFIDPDVCGCGVGRMLVEHALSMAPELTTNVNEQNEQAVGFYKKVGFKVTGRSEVDDLGKPYPLLNLAYVGE
ncbi:acetyltransferase [Escherichia coli]|nr:acetyltransferase [Escherichia coli]